MILPVGLLQMINALRVNGDEDERRKNSIDKLKGSREIMSPSVVRAAYLIIIHISNII